MRNLDESTITEAVLARHSEAGVICGLGASGYLVAIQALALGKSLRFG